MGLPSPTVCLVCFITIQIQVVLKFFGPAESADSVPVSYTKSESIVANTTLTSVSCPTQSVGSYPHFLAVFACGSLFGFISAIVATNGVSPTIGGGSVIRIQPARPRTANVNPSRRRFTLHT